MKGLVLFQRAGNHVGVLTLNVPEKLNALSVDVGIAFEERIQQVKKEKDLRAVVLTGAGNAFSAGGDLAFLDARASVTPKENADEMRRYYARFLSIRQVQVPVIAAINGSAVGAGMALASWCDLRVASEDAKLGVNFSRLGIHAGLGSTHVLPQVVGVQQANRLLLTGELISGAEAARIGLVAECVPKERVLPRALEMAQQIADNSPIAVQTTLQTLRSKQEVGLEQSLAREADQQALCYAHGDLTIGLQAVRDKKKPKF